MSTVQLLNLLVGFLTLIEQGTIAYVAVARVRDDVKHMVDEGRDPTDEEWAALMAALEDSHTRIQDS